MRCRAAGSRARRSIASASAWRRHGQAGDLVHQRVGARLAQCHDARHAEEGGLEDGPARGIEVRRKAQHIHAPVGERDLARRAEQVHAGSQVMSGQEGLGLGAHVLRERERPQDPRAQAT
jgi:hypothetical protein